MAAFLLSSIVASIALTLVLNLMIRAFPGTSAHARAREMFGEQQARPDEMVAPEDAKRIQVFFPWRQMLLWSMALTVLFNVIRFLG